MVDCDPLYLVDDRHELLIPTISRHHEIYQRRLRPYVINERQDGEILTALPNNQFGLIFAYNFFNYKPFEVIRRYLEELYQKLRPGGVLIMTINDCDRDKGVVLVEQHFCCYTPGKMVIELAQSLGFKTVFTWTDNGPSTWIELQHPGELTSLRGGQTLAKVVPK
jgi:SAM-dependent methyltransferase